MIAILLCLNVHQIQLLHYQEIKNQIQFNLHKKCIRWQLYQVTAYYLWLPYLMTICFFLTRLARFLWNISHSNIFGMFSIDWFCLFVPLTHFLDPLILLLIFMIRCGIFGIRCLLFCLQCKSGTQVFLEAAAGGRHDGSPYQALDHHHHSDDRDDESWSCRRSCWSSGW